MELVGLEPATSWVRSRRSLALSLACLQGTQPRPPIAMGLGFVRSLREFTRVPSRGKLGVMKFIESRARPSCPPGSTLAGGCNKSRVTAARGVCRPLFAVEAERGEIRPCVDAIPGTATEAWAEQRTDRRVPLSVSRRAIAAWVEDGSHPCGTS